MKKLLPLLFILLVGALNVSAQSEKTENQDGKPSEVIKLFFTRVCNDEIDNALKLLSKKINARQYQLRGMLEAGAKECKQNKGLQSVEIAEEKIKDKNASVLGVRTFQNGKQKGLDMKLVLEEGSWKVTFTPPK